MAKCALIPNPPDLQYTYGLNNAVYLKFYLDPSEYTTCPIIILQAHSYFGITSVFVSNEQIPLGTDYMVQKNKCEFRTNRNFSGLNLVGVETPIGSALLKLNGPGVGGTLCSMLDHQAVSCTL